MGTSKINYLDLFESIFGEVPPTGSIAYSDLMNDPRLPAALSLATKKKHLRTYIERNPAQLKRLCGMIPNPETVISVVEAEIGPITEEILDEANRRCSDVVNGITNPMVGKFVQESLAPYYSEAADSYSISASKLNQFLLEEFSGYLKAAGNGLVSVAGLLNEKLLQRAMANAGMVPGKDFSVTGTDSEGDIVIHTTSGFKENLGVEVKSYHARERLLRGLKDVREPKVGVGYFKDPSEFNHGRTITLLQARPAAIFIPMQTLGNIEASARAVTTNEKIAFASALYRPLEQFATDMKHYSATGVLPLYKG